MVRERLNTTKPVRERIDAAPKQRGGYRPGSGRRKGSLGKKSVEARERAMSSGLLPHEFLHKVSLGEPIECRRKVDGKATCITWYPTPEQQIEAAGKCAAFFQPKLLSQKVAGPDDGPMVVKLDTDILQALPEQLLTALQALVGALSKQGIGALTKHHEQEDNGAPYGNSLH